MDFELFAVRRDRDGLWFCGARRGGWDKDVHRAQFYHSRPAAECSARNLRVSCSVWAFGVDYAEAERRVRDGE